MLIENKLLTEVEGKYKIKYTKYKGQWPVSDRDFVSVIGVEKESDKKIYIATTSCSYPYPEQNKVVRGEIIVGGYII